MTLCTSRFSSAHERVPVFSSTRTISGPAVRQVWDATTGSELHSFQHKHIVRCCGFAKDGHRLATGGMEKVVRVFDTERPEMPPLEISGAPSGIRRGSHALQPGPAALHRKGRSPRMPHPIRSTRALFGWW